MTICGQCVLAYLGLGDGPGDAGTSVAGLVAGSGDHRTNVECRCVRHWSRDPARCGGSMSHRHQCRQPPRHRGSVGDTSTTSEDTPPTM